MTNSSEIPPAAIALLQLSASATTFEGEEKTDGDSDWNARISENSRRISENSRRISENSRPGETYYNAFKMKVEPKLRKLYSKKRRSIDPDDCDILQTVKMAEVAEMVLSDKQNRMKLGKTWEIVIGNWHGFKMLPTKHPSHCDVANEDANLYIQLKNKYNTTCSDAATQINFRLAEFKHEHPDATVVWGIINPRKKHKSTGLREFVTYKDQTIEKWHGKYLFDRVFTHDGYNYFNDVLQFIQSLMVEHGM